MKWVDVLNVQRWIYDSALLHKLSKLVVIVKGFFQRVARRNYFLALLFLFSLVLSMTVSCASGPAKQVYVHLMVSPTHPGVVETTEHVIGKTIELAKGAFNTKVRLNFQVIQRDQITEAYGDFITDSPTAAVQRLKAEFDEFKTTVSSAESNPNPLSRSAVKLSEVVGQLSKISGDADVKVKVVVIIPDKLTDQDIAAASQTMQAPEFVSAAEAVVGDQGICYVVPKDDILRVSLVFKALPSKAQLTSLSGPEQSCLRI